MAPAGSDLSTWRPLILGVIFHSQMRLGNKNTATVTEADSVRFNYSVDGGSKEALKNDVEVSRMTDNFYWFDGYYDATEDRKWTWDDINRLAVKFGRPVARGNVIDKNLISSVQAIVKYYVPAKASPYFFAKVSDTRCETLQLNTGIFRAGSPMTSADPVDLKAAQPPRALCSAYAYAPADLDPRAQSSRPGPADPAAHPGLCRARSSSQRVSASA